MERLNSEDRAGPNQDTHRARPLSTARDAVGN